MPALVSVGYQGRSLEQLVSQLVSQRVSLLVDVRMTPLSRKPGMSKRKLAAALELAGIRYIHVRALGNPKENRESFRAGDRAARSAYRQRLRDDQGVEALHRIATLLSDEVVALLCFERDHETCHRHVVVDELHQTVPGLQLVAI